MPVFGKDHAQDDWERGGIRPRCLRVPDVGCRSRARRSFGMAIPSDDTITKHEIEEKRRQEAREEAKEDQRRKTEGPLDRALEGTFPASDPISVTQPAPSVHDKKPQR
jgi:hypothetical protein